MVVYSCTIHKQNLNTIWEEKECVCVCVKDRKKKILRFLLKETRSQSVNRKANQQQNLATQLFNRNHTHPFFLFVRTEF